MNKSSHERKIHSAFMRASRRTLESMSETERQEAWNRHSRASKASGTILAMQTERAISSHREACRRNSKYASLDFDAVLIMLASGMTKTAIAVDLGMDRGTLADALKRFGM
jgi:hypothetical protein